MNKPTTLNYLTGRNPVDLNQVSMEARQLPHPYLSKYQETSDSCTCA
jgi:hypothetical protein